MILFQDLTGLRQMEEAVRRADRLAVVGGLAAGLAHEIRNPLASMCGSIEVLGAAPGLDEQERRLMQVVRSEAERLEALVREFLSFARPNSPAFEPLDGARAVADTVELFRVEVAERGIELVARADAPVLGAGGSEPAPPGALEPARERRRCDASRRAGGGADGLPGRAGRPGSGGHRPRHRRRGRAAHLRSVLHHQGARHRARPRHRAPDRRGHGGHLSVRSEVGRGTTFRVALPLAPAVSVPPRSAVG